MGKQKVWHSINEIFDALNNSGCNYIVMRNFECFTSGQVFVNGHDDIDMLCDDISLVQEILDTRRRYSFPTVNSYYIQYNDLVVHVDIRFLGDGYYDLNWQNNMLKNKVIFNNNTYVMDSENYFYSLIYHAIFHKHYLSNDYLEKLLNMAKNNCLNCKTEDDLLYVLFSFMKEKNYNITLSRDPAIILNFKNIEEIDIKVNHFWLLKRKLLNTLRKIKRIDNKYV